MHEDSIYTDFYNLTGLLDIWRGFLAMDKDSQ
jgi:hypothetical protein